MKDCNACAKCCTRYGGGGLSATRNERDYWEEYRPDIDRYVSPSGDIWVDPGSGKTLDHCPFLQPGAPGTPRLCTIYAVRPEDCRLYPSSLEEMVEDDCEMLESTDLKHPRRARKALDERMRDSRLGWLDD